MWLRLACEAMEMDLAGCVTHPVPPWSALGPKWEDGCWCPTVYTVTPQRMNSDEFIVVVQHQAFFSVMPYACKCFQDFEIKLFIGWLHGTFMTNTALLVKT